MSWLHVRPRPSPFALRCATISVRPMRRGRSHPPSPRPPPVLSKPRSQELRRTGAASDSSMISDGRSSGPDKKEVGAARAAGRSSSSLDESPMTAPPEELGPPQQAKRSRSNLQLAEGRGSPHTSTRGRRDTGEERGLAPTDLAVPWHSTPPTSSPTAASRCWVRPRGVL